MNAITKTIEAAPSPLARLREPFPPHQVSKLPKPTKQQTEEVKADFKKGIRCPDCGSWHHPQVVHLDYVGHAALTDRLLEVDDAWSWEPLALRDGLPAFDATGGLWIRLTVCGVSRLGYGHAAAKPNIDPGAREKEVIGDALRNAAMRFGAALDLWHKGDLHLPDTDEAAPQEAAPQRSVACAEAIRLLNMKAKDGPLAFKSFWETNKAGMKTGLPPAEYAEVVGIMKALGADLKAAAPVETPLDPNDPFNDEIPF